MNLSAQLDFRIPFQDVDSMRVVWHGNYVRYFEQVRAELLRNLGYTYGDMEAAGYVFPIVTLEVKFTAPARFDERVRVVATLVPCDLCLDIKYVVTSLDTGARLCKGKTRQMAVSVKTGESLYRLPEPLLSKMEEVL